MIKLSKVLLLPFCPFTQGKQSANLKYISKLVKILWIDESVVMTKDVGWDGVLMFWGYTGGKKIAHLKDFRKLVKINETLVLTNDVGWDGGVLMFLQNARDRR